MVVFHGFWGGKNQELSVRLGKNVDRKSGRIYSTVEDAKDLLVPEGAEVKSIACYTEKEWKCRQKTQTNVRRTKKPATIKRQRGRKLVTSR